MPIHSASDTDSINIDVLIVSLCKAERRNSILRALESVVSQEGVSATPVIVVNGDRFDPVLFEQLKARRDIRVLYQPEPSIFLARRLARERCRTPFFAMLDDDDELLPGALRTRLRPLLDDPALDVVVTNGYLINGTREGFMLDSVESIQNDPPGALMSGNWLATASGLFRASSITPEYFDPTLQSNDMTFLAFQIGLKKSIRFLDVPTYRKQYSADSISLTVEWSLPASNTLERMLQFDMPADVRRKLRRKLGHHLHDLSTYYLGEGNMAAAWRCHLASLKQPDGVHHYALYTRKLIRGWFAGESYRLKNYRNRSFEGPKAPNS
jgi:hypothetical protein